MQICNDAYPTQISVRLRNQGATFKTCPMNPGSCQLSRVPSQWNGHLGIRDRRREKFCRTDPRTDGRPIFCVWVDGAVRLRGAITKGRVTGRWARRHHRMWLLNLLVNGSVLKRTASVERIPFQ